MKRGPLIALVVMTAVVAGFVAALRAGAMPLGVRGEWEWLRVPFSPGTVDLALASLGVFAYAVFAGLGYHALEKRPTPAREAMLVTALAAASVAVQAVAQSGAPVGYGLAKWVLALHQPGSSGYFTVAKSEVRGLSRFLARYPTWIEKQDALHIGTHPPGLIATEYALLRAMQARPGTARLIDDHVPESVARAFRVFGGARPMSLTDRATLALTGLLTLLACGLTVVPLYGLARASLPPPLAWAASALWPLVPSAVLFQPTADTAFPLLSTSALALGALAVRTPPARGRWPAFLAGLILAVGMQYSLAFLAVGLVTALLIVSAVGRSPAEKGAFLVAVGLGFLAFTLAFWLASRANPFAIWWVNQRNHARFYVEYPRSYLAWVVANPVELAVGLGLPATGWLLVGLFKIRAMPRVCPATLAVLALLTLSGRNLSEVVRLWLPLMPALLVGSGYGLGKLGCGPKSVAATVLLVGLQTLALQATIQVVYPV